MSEDLKRCWYWKESLPANIKEEELCNIVKESCDELYFKLKNFRSDVRSYEKIVYHKTTQGGYGDAGGATEIQDLTYVDQLENSPYLTFNVIKSAIETITNKMGSIKPKIEFTTDNATRALQEIANKLEKWGLMVFKRNRIWSEGSKTFQSACISGLGVMKVHLKVKSKNWLKKVISYFNPWWKDDKYLKFWNVPVLDFFCDNAYYGKNKPTIAGELKSFKIYDLIMMYPKKKGLILFHHGKNVEDGVKVYEVYKKYQRHVICTERVMLLDEEWNYDVPYVTFNWQKTPQGVLGSGLAKGLFPIHTTITYILAKTLNAIENVSTPTLFVDQGTAPKITDAENIGGRVIAVNTGSNDMQPMVKYTTPQPINQQVLDILNLLWMRAFETIGVNQLASAGKIPEELKGASGIAIRSYEAIQANRFQDIRENFEIFYIDLFKKALDTATEDMLPEGIKPEDIREMLDHANAFPASILPDTPAGRLAAVTDYINAMPNAFTPDKIFDLLNSPDTNKFKSSESSRIRAIQMRIEKALEKGEKPILYPELGLNEYLEEARKFIAQTLVEDMEDKKNIERVQLLQTFIGEIEEAKLKKDNALQIPENTGNQGMTEAQPTTPAQQQPQIVR